MELEEEKAKMENELDDMRKSIEQTIVKHNREL